jgi:hypothetical protein
MTTAKNPPPRRQDAKKNKKEINNRKDGLRFGFLWHLGALAVLYMIPVLCFSQTVSSGAGLVTPLTALGASARADALGGAVVGLADDPSALFFNPAGLSQLRSTSLSINHNSYLAGSFEETLLFGLPTGSLGGFAAALQYVSWGSLDKRDPYGVDLGSFSDSDTAFSVGWGTPLMKNLSLGIALHGEQQKIVDTLYTGLSGDLGFLWLLAPGLCGGLSYTGLGTNLAGYTPAQDLRLGFSDVLNLGKGTDLRPLLVGDWEPNGESRIQAGLEGTMDRDYCLRVGYQGTLSDNQIDGLTGFTAGAGVRLGTFELDYAFVPYGDLGTSHRISLGYEFPNPTPVIPKPVTVVAPPVTVVAPHFMTPVPAGLTKSKVEVRFELPAGSSTPTAQGQASTVLAPYEEAVRKNQQDSQAWRALGIVYFKTGQTALGIQCLEQALRLKPDDLALKKWLDDYHTKYPAKP